MAQIKTKFIADDAVTNAKLAEMATATIKGNVTGGTANPTDLTGTQVNTILPAFTGDSGSGGVKGLVPAPASGDATKFLRGDGVFATIPGSSTDIEESITLNGTNITNQYVDLAHAALGASASVNSVQLTVVGGPVQQKTVDYTVSLTGGSGGVTRITFAGDLATGGAAALVSSDILIVTYSY